MSVIYVVLPLALVVVAGGIAVFIWNARSGQFDDLDTPALRVLHDDEAGRRERGDQSTEKDDAGLDSRIETDPPPTDIG